VLPASVRARFVAAAANAVDRPRQELVRSQATRSRIDDFGTFRATARGLSGLTSRSLIGPPLGVRFRLLLVSPTRTTERSGLPLPSRLTQAIQWGPRLHCEFDTSLRPWTLEAESIRFWPEFARIRGFWGDLHCVRPRPFHRIELPKES
jgi:hypothetical protein